MKHIKICKPNKNREMEGSSKRDLIVESKELRPKARVSTLVTEGLGCVPTEIVIVDRD